MGWGRPESGWSRTESTWGRIERLLGPFLELGAEELRTMSEEEDMEWLSTRLSQADFILQSRHDDPGSAPRISLSDMPTPLKSEGTRRRPPTRPRSGKGPESPGPEAKPDENTETRDEDKTGTRKNKEGGRARRTSRRSPSSKPTRRSAQEERGREMATRRRSEAQKQRAPQAARARRPGGTRGHTGTTRVLGRRERRSS